MKLLIPFVVLLIIVLADASIVHTLSKVARLNHIHVSRRASSLEIHVRAPSEKRCPNRKNKAAVSNSTSSSPKPQSTSNKNNIKPLPPKGTPTPVVTNNGLLQVNNGKCGNNGATKDVTSVSGPNGNMDWMNCGFEAGGWSPPHVRVQDLITVSLSVALQNPNSPFKACGPFIGMFEKYGAIYSVPPIMLASFAMQESSCQPWRVGGGGEQGLMQITHDKCGGAPGGDCKNPDFNIGQGAKYFSATLSSVGGNVFLAVGTYNGWRPGLTRWAAFAAAQSACCMCQNNGDYLMQFFNGWILNIDPTNSQRRLGKYFNLDVCRR